MSKDPSSLPKFPDPDPPKTGGDEEPLHRQSAAWVVYAVAVVWICVGALPLLIVSSMAGPVAAMGASLVLGSQLWLFTQIFEGNPVVALVVLLIPILGSLLVLKFLIDHWSIARWPALCQIVGFALCICGLANHARA